MKRKKLPFASAEELKNLIDQYFKFIKGKKARKVTDPAGKPKAVEQRIWIYEPVPATISGLALYLGFNSHDEFEEHETKGKFADQLKQARLRIIADYEKKLHITSSTGAIFALKSMGWNERTDDKSAGDTFDKTLKIEIIESGPKLASTEKEVVL